MSSLNKKTKKIPTLRFPEFTGEWEEKRLGEVLKIGSGRDYKHLEKGDIPVFGTGGYMLSVNKPLYSGETVFIGRKGTIDKPFYYNGDFWTVDTLFYTYGFDGITTSFTNHIFQRINWKKYNEASGVPSLSKTTIEKIKQCFPSLPEQQKIASFLESVDKWLENLRSEKEALEKYKKGVMQKIFSREIRFKDENGKDYPEWEEKRLGEVADVLRSDGLSKADLNNNGVNMTILYGELFTKYNEVSTKVISRTNKSTKLKSHIGDILMPTSDVTPRGLATATALMVKDVYLGGDMNVIRLKKDNNPIFFSYFLNFNKSEIIRFISGSTIMHIYPKDIKKLKIYIPTLPEQQKIVSFLESIDNLIESKQSLIIKADDWKKGLMQGLFC